jgi:SAM-dependent methyltransferase
MVQLAELLNGALLRRWALPFRQSHPRTYATVNRLRQRVLANGEPLTGYQANAVRRVAALGVLDGARVLELGSDPRMEVLRALHRRGARACVGVNNAERVWTGRDARTIEEGPLSLHDADAAALPFENGSFDVVFSVAVLEHVSDLAATLSEARRVLRAGGTFYAAFGPIWSSRRGHHLLVEEDGKIVAHHGTPALNPLPDFSHLLLDPHEIRRGLNLRIRPELADAVADFVAHSTYVNRLFHHEYLTAFRASSMELVSLRPERDPVEPDLLRLLALRWPLERDFDVSNSEVVLRRP